MSDKTINTLGLVLELIGVFLLFRFGMPFHVPTGGASLLTGYEIDQAVVALEQCYMVWGYVGLALLLLGTALQIVATWWRHWRAGGAWVIAYIRKLVAAK